MAVEFNKPSRLEKIWASGGSKTPEPDDAKVALGHIVEIPKKETFNYIDYKQDAMLAHINQHGVPVWDSTSQYLQDLSYVMGSNGVIYRAKLDNVNVNPVTEVGAVNWAVAFHFASAVYTKTESDAAYARKSNNLSDLSNIATARNNLSVYSKSETDNAYSTKAQNLNDLASKPAAFDNIKQAATESFAGTLALSTNSQAIAGSDNTTAITPAKLKLGVLSSISATGYVVLPSWFFGLTIQWVRSSVPNGGGSYSVVWPRVFPNGCLGAWTGYWGDDGGSSATCWIASAPSTTGVQIDHGSGSPKNMITFSIGY